MSTLVTRAGKGSPLTHNEVDANFTNLNTDKIQSGNTVAALTITALTTPSVQAGSSAGLALKNSAGTTQISMGAGGGDNITVAAPIAITPANGLVNIAPTGTGSLTINPATAGTMNNMAIGATTASTGAFSTLSATGNVSFDGGSFVFNEAGADKDARFEGDTDANLLFLDASTDRIGIGTSSPSTKLHVETSSTGDAFKVAKGGNYLIMGGSGSGTQYVKGYEGVVAFGNAFAGSTSFLTGDTERMRIDGSGNVGIGVTSPKAKLNILNTSSVSQRLSTTTDEHNYFHRAVRSVSVTSWATIFTITASGNSSNWMRGSVKLTAGGHTSGVANGLLQDAVYYIDMNDSTMSAGSVSAGTSSGSGAPQFQVVVSGTTWLVQIQSSNGSNGFDGIANVEFNIPNPAGNARTFTIT
jgi:hypothetical protein